MDIGTGIAIVGTWLFPSACAISPEINGSGMVKAVICAIGVTIAVLW